MQKIFIQFLNTLSRVTKKRVIYITDNYINENNLAVKTKLGFWYCGNVFNYGDIAYGFASNGVIEDFDMSIVQSILSLSNTNKTYTFYDIGCNTGPYTLLAATSNETTHVHSFDPVKEHLVTLKQALALNRFENRVTLHEVGLSSENKQETIYLSGSGSTVEKDFLNGDVPTRTIQLESLDNYILTNKLPLPNFIKIDVEGHEYYAIEGATKTLQESKPILFIEIALHLGNIGRDFTNKNFDKIFTKLESLGYEAYVSYKDTLVKRNAVIINDGVFMYLFLDKETHLKNNDLLKILKIN